MKFSCDFCESNIKHTQKIYSDFRQLEIANDFVTECGSILLKTLQNP